MTICDPSRDHRHRPAHAFRRLRAAEFRSSLPWRAHGPGSLAALAQSAGGGAAEPGGTAALRRSLPRCRPAAAPARSGPGPGASHRAGRGGDEPGRSGDGVCRHRRGRQHPAVAPDPGGSSRGAAEIHEPGRRLVSDPDPERDPAAAELARRHQPRPRPAGRLQDRHLLWLPRCLGHRLYSGLHRGRLGRPPRWQLLARTHGARGGSTHPLRRLRSAPDPPDRPCAAARGRAGGDQCRAPRHAALFRCPADAGPPARLQRGQGRAGDRLSRRWLDHRAGSPGPGAEEPAARCRWRRFAAALAGERQAHRLDTLPPRGGMAARRTRRGTHHRDRRRGPRGLSEVWVQ